MSLDAIITESASILNAMTGIGRVHPYLRSINDDATFKAQCVDEAGVLHAWMITREATPSADSGIHTAKDSHNIVLRGYRAVQDALNSEATFQVEVEAVRAAFNAHRGLNGKAFDSKPMSCRLVTSGMYRGVLVHYCELVMVAEAYAEMA